MLVPLSWLAEYTPVPTEITARDLAAALIRVGLEVETVREVAPELSGPLVLGRVLDYIDEPQTNGKTIRWCQVDVGQGSARGIVCGARNFDTGDAVVVALPGTTLPGGVRIEARSTYGHVSDGMICSVRELGLGEEHAGILVLADADLVGHGPGEDARSVLGLPDTVLDIAVTPDRGYCLSVRGVARELAGALGLTFDDPGLRPTPAPDPDGWPVQVLPGAGCDRFVARTVTGLDPAAVSPLWLRRRLWLGGMRPVSLPVDVTNYVMLLTGQPLHGYDQRRLAGPILVRRAAGGEVLRTLDGALAQLTADDLVIADGSGPVGLAGVMGGAGTGLSADCTDVVIEAAHFDPVQVARTARRHRFTTEASRRFERGVDDELAPVAAQVAVDLMCELAGAAPGPGVTDVDLRSPRAAVRLAVAEPGRLVGVPLPEAEVREHLATVGCRLSDSGPEHVLVTAPSWRPDLLAPADLIEEIARLHGYATIPSQLPPVPAGADHRVPQRDEVRAARALAGAGLVEVRSSPFTSTAALDVLGVPAGDVRRRALRLANPLSEAEPLLRTSMLPGLLATVRRNLGRGNTDLAVFEIARVFRPAEHWPPAPRLGVEGPPDAAGLAALHASLPDQPRYLAAVFTGAAEPPGWWGPARPYSWADAVHAAHLVAGAVRARITVRAAQAVPWHPGRCAEIWVHPPAGADELAATAAGTDHVVGYAGELHPRVCVDLDLPERTCALELDLTALTAGADTRPVRAPVISPYPVATQDVALVVDTQVSAADVQAALTAGAGPLLESVRLFDVYTGDQVGEGRKSLAFALRLRAPDRTLTAEETATARVGAVTEASRRTGAVLRS